MSNIKFIQSLRAQGWTFTRIAGELGVHRTTVAKYVRRHCDPDAGLKPKPTQLHTGSTDSKPTPAPTGSGEAGRSTCEPFRAIILEKLALGLSATRIHQDLADEHDFSGSYYAVMRFVRRLKQASPLPFRRIETAPGEEAQVDFGTGARVVDETGRRKKTHLFRIVLSYSRKAYSEVVYRQTTENFIRALENAFWEFGGVPRTLVIDNLRAAVTKADWYEPELNRKMESFCEHYGVVVLPNKPYMPRHKGKVEAGVKYAQDNALKGRTFASLNQQNDHLAKWEATVADTRIHGTTKRQVGKVFQEERETLAPLRGDRFPFFHEGQRKVNRDGHIEVDRSYYSIPPEYFGRRVWVRWDGRLVRVFNHRRDEIAVHVKVPPGKFNTHPQHIAPEKIGGIERGAEWLLMKASAIGPYADQWAQAVIRGRGIEGLRTVMGLLSMADKYTHSELDKACQIAVNYGAYRLKNIRTLLKTQTAHQEQLEFMEDHPIIREIGVYGDLVRTAFQNAPRRDLPTSSQKGAP
jgi:transposase